MVVAPLANFAISVAIPEALLASLFFVEARLPQFSTVSSVFVVAVMRIYSHSARPKLKCL